MADSPCFSLNVYNQIRLQSPAKVQVTHASEAIDVTSLHEVTL